MLGDPELDAGLQVGSHKSGVKGKNPLPQPAGHTSLGAAQDMVGFPGCKCTLLAYVELLIHQYPQVLLLGAALFLFSIKHFQEAELKSAVLRRVRMRNVRILLKSIRCLGIQLSRWVS